MSVDVIVESGGWDAERLSLRASECAAATLRHLGLDPDGFEIAVLACDDARIAALNADFRGKPQPTNVLSWPSQDRAPTIPGATPEPPEPGDADFGPTELGDIALAFETCQREAAGAGLDPDAHVSHLVVHGTLHLLGYDHVREEDAVLMEGLETQILASLGVADPYRDRT